MADLGAMLSDPDFLKWMGNAGAGLGSGQSIGQALGGQNLSGAIEGRANQNANASLLENLLAQLSPAGQKGPSKITQTITGDGKTKMVIDGETEKNRNTFGTSVPVEVQQAPQPQEISDPTLGQQQVSPVAQGGNRAPFFKALLGEYLG